MEWCGLLWCFYQLFGLLFWRHPFTAEHPLLTKWCSATFLQIWWRHKLIYILDGLRVSTSSANFHFGDLFIFCVCFIILPCLSSYSPVYFCKCITANIWFISQTERYLWESCQRCCSYNIQPRTLCFNFIVQTLSWLIFTQTDLIQNPKLLVIMNLNWITDSIAGNEQSWSSLAWSDAFHYQLLWLQQWPSNHDRDYCFFKSVWLRAVSSFTRVQTSADLFT